MALAVGVGAVASAGAACTPKIGDSCANSTDCSTRGDRLCDVSQSQLGGYCTVLNCGAGSCPDDGVCVLFNSAVPGCGYDDRSGTTGSRVARSFCTAQCTSDSDCRGGYVCVDPRTYPWNAVVLDNDQSRKTCLAFPLEGLDGGADAGDGGIAPVCGPAGPPVSPIDAGPAKIHDAGITPPPLFGDGG